MDQRSQQSTGKPEILGSESAVMGFGLRKRRKGLFIASTLWAVLISSLSLQPASSIRAILPSTLLVSLAHIPIYGVMAFLLCLYLRFRRCLGTFRLTGRSVLIIAFVLTVVWGGLNEGFQVGRAGRVADWFDFYCNVVGAAGGSFFFVLFRKLRFLR